MGLYVEPDGMGKRTWCEEYGQEIANIDGIDFDKLTDEHMIVCLVDNVVFYALGVAFDKQEFERFKSDDDRFKRWFFVNRNRIREDSPMWYDYMNETQPNKYKVMLGKALRFLLPPAFLLIVVKLFIVFVEMYQTHVGLVMLIFLMMYGLDNVLLDWSPTWKKVRGQDA